MFKLECGCHVERLLHHGCVSMSTSNTAIAIITMRKSIHQFPFLSYLCKYGAHAGCRPVLLLNGLFKFDFKVLGVIVGNCRPIRNK